MATAEAVITKTLVPPPPPAEYVTKQTGVTLHLSMDEARFLSAVMAKIGGDPIKSLRRHQSPISCALEEVGGYYVGVPDTQQGGHSIYFADGT